MTTQMSTTDANKALVAAYVAEVWNGKNVDAVKRFVSDDLVQHNPNLPNGRGALEDFMRDFFQNVPQGEFVLARLIAEGDLVVSHALFRVNAEDRGTSVVDLYRVHDAKLIEHWDVKEAVPAESASGNPVV